MAQFFLKIPHLSFSMGPTPILKMAVSYGLHPRLWLLSKIYLMWPRKIQAQVAIYRTFYVFAIDNINQGMNCLIFSVLACVTKSVMNYFVHSVTQSDPNSYCAIKMGMNASSICYLSKLTSAFVLVLIEWKLTRLNSYTGFLKDFSEVNQNC